MVQGLKFRLFRRSLSKKDTVITVNLKYIGLPNRLRSEKWTSFSDSVSDFRTIQGVSQKFKGEKSCGGDLNIMKKIG